MLCEFNVTVIAKHAHSRWELDKSGALQCYLTNEPLSEAANKEIIHAIAEAAGVSLSKVTIVHGIHEYVKLVRINDRGVTIDDVIKGFGLVKE